MDTALEASKQFLTVTGILAGFSFTGVLQLASLNDRRRIIVATLSAFIIATFAFTISMFGFFFAILTINAYFKDLKVAPPPQLGNSLIVLALIFFAGIFMLSVGVVF